MCGAACSPNGAREAAGLGDPREKGNLGESTKRSRAGVRPITLHGASLRKHMHAAVQKVKLIGRLQTSTCLMDPAAQEGLNRKDIEILAARALDRDLDGLAAAEMDKEPLRSQVGLDLIVEGHPVDVGI